VESARFSFDLHLERRVARIEAEDFPAFIVVDDKGNDFFAAD